MKVLMMKVAQENPLPTTLLCCTTWKWKRGGDGEVKRRGMLQGSITALRVTRYGPSHYNRMVCYHRLCSASPCHAGLPHTQKLHQCVRHEARPGVHIDIFGTGGNELHPSFTVNFPDKTYLFNCGEGWERMRASHRKRVAGKRMFFFTRACWENFGGSSVFHHSREGHSMRQEFLGPRRSDHILEYIMYFKGRNSWHNSRLDSDSVLHHEFKDQNLSVRILDIDPSGGEGEDDGHVVAYVCELMRKEATSNIKELAGLEDLLGNGVAGNIREQDQLGNTKGATFLVVDCPGKKFVRPVTADPHLQPEWFSERGRAVDLIIHITPFKRLESERYCKWMGKFGEGTKHLLLHGSVCPGEVGYRAAMSFSLPFHFLNSNVYHFPRLPDSNSIPKSSLTASKYVGEDAIEIGRMFMKYYLSPRVEVDTTSCFGSVQEHVSRDIANIMLEEKEMFQHINSHRKRLLMPSVDEKSAYDYLMEDSMALSPAGPDDAMVTILGTSATKATPIRNVTGILIQTLTDGNILLDCGEGTLCQLQRAFGKKGAEDILKKLKVIFISHAHLDHHMGLIGVLKAVQSLNRDCELTIIAELGFLQMLKRYHSKCESIPMFEGVDSSTASRQPFNLTEGIVLKTVPANHIQTCYSIMVRKRNKWSIVFSADTRPSRYLAQKGCGASLLIHEGTYVSKSPRAADTAKLNKHSTYYEAVRVGELMRAQFTIVTHFSTMFSLEPLLLTESYKATCPAVDLMSVRLSDLNKQLLDSSNTALISIGSYSKSLL